MINYSFVLNIIILSSCQYKNYKYLKISYFFYQIWQSQKYIKIVKTAITNACISASFPWKPSTSLDAATLLFSNPENARNSLNPWSLTHVWMIRARENKTISGCSNLAVEQFLNAWNSLNPGSLTHVLVICALENKKITDSTTSSFSTLKNSGNSLKPLPLCVWAIYTYWNRK